SAGSKLSFRGPPRPCDMQDRTFKGKVLLAALVVLANVSNGERLGNASCANDDDQALLQARVKNACSPDETPPVPTVPSDIEVVNQAGECFAVVTYAFPTATDDCDPDPSISQSGGLGSGEEFPVGSTTETFTVIDDASNFDSASFHVVVTDAEDPDMTPVPADIIVDTDPGVCDKVVTFPTPTATDNCPNPVIALTAGKASGSTFELGITTQTFTATDASGNSISDVFHVQVKDNENPGIAGLPSSSTHGNDAGLCGAIVNYAAPTATDNCADPVLSQDAGLAPGSLFPVGTTTNIYIATDAAGNAATGGFTVTVNDAEPPVISGVPSDITVSNAAGTCAATVNYAPPTLTDNCPGGSIPLTSGLGSGSSFPVGATTETYTATDAAGNAATGGFTVTVNDAEPPVISGVPSDITVSNAAGATIETYTATDASNNIAEESFTVTVNDIENPVPNLPANIVVNNDNGLGSGSSFPVGTTLNIYTAIDAAGNIAGPSSFTVTVFDNENPVISGVPADITVNNIPGTCAATVTYVAPTATDNCQGASIALTSGPTSGASFPVGSTDVSYTATDGAGRTASRTFTVQVNDNEPPTLEVEDIDVKSCSPTTVTFSPAAADNCPGVTAACSPSSGSEFPVGETEVTCTAVDAAGKTTQESFVVLVECDGHGYYKKSHGNNIRKRRNPHMKKWLHYWNEYRR
ncbi:unnamed protein product, partial [Symbiodinium sp. CCMP2456]